MGTNRDRDGDLTTKREWDFKSRRVGIDYVDIAHAICQRISKGWGSVGEVWFVPETT
jgi:hypothetical protein